MRSSLLVLFYLCTVLSSYAQETLLSKEALAQKKVYTSFAEASKNPQDVYVLRLSYQNYGFISSEIANFSNLQILDLSFNKLRKLPDEIKMLKNLQYVYLNRNLFEEFPRELV
ncbi:MAG: leucine-rich repeat domain-containing protein, partial [Bacteroidota bacterium]